jgi:hypothetical protein
MGKHYGAFAKGFSDSLIAMMRLAMTKELYDARAEYYRSRGYAYEHPKDKGALDPGTQSAIDKEKAAWGGGGGGGGGSPPNASDFEKFKYGLTGEESGGKYGIVNKSSGAVGRYQIMPANVGPWTKQYLGKEMTPEEFRNDPAAQDKVFEGKIGDYYKQYGNWRDVASMWHSGVPYDQAVREGRHDVNETTANYVDHVMASSRLGGSSDPGTAVASTPSATMLTGADDTTRTAASSPNVKEMTDTGPNGVYANIPAKDSKGRDQLPMFKRWNPDPVGNEASNLKQINPDMQKVIARARADNPDLKFVLGNGKRSAADQDWAKSVGWSQVGSKDGGDASVHMKGDAADLWALDDKNRVTFDPGAQSKVTAAIKKAAQEEGVRLNAGDDWRHPDKPHFELAAPTTAKAPTKGPDKGKVAQAAPEGPPVLHTPYQVAGEAGGVTEAGAERAARTLAEHRAAPTPRPGAPTATEPAPATPRLPTREDIERVESESAATPPSPTGQDVDRPPLGPDRMTPSDPASAGAGRPPPSPVPPPGAPLPTPPDLAGTNSGPFLGRPDAPVTTTPQPIVNTVRPEAPGVGGRGLPPAPTPSEVPGTNFVRPEPPGAPVATINPQTDRSPVNMGPYPRADTGARPDLTARSPAMEANKPSPAATPVSATAPRAIPATPAQDPRFVQVDRPNAPANARGPAQQMTALDLSHLWGPNPPVADRAPAPPGPPPPPPQAPPPVAGRPQDDWGDVASAPDMSDIALGMQLGAAKGGPITRRVSLAKGGAIPSRPIMKFAAGGASAQYPSYTPAAPNMTSIQGNELAANQFMLGLPGMTPVDTSNPIPGYYTSYGPGQGGAGGQQLIQDWSRMTPDQQKQYSQMTMGTWQPPAATPAVAPAAAPAAAPAPVINPPSVQNITNYAGTPSDPSGVTTIDPTSTTTTGTPGVPTTGLQAATYDPNKIATTGSGSTTNSTGGTDYSTDPNDQTKQILSAKGGAIPSRPMMRFATGGAASYGPGGLLSPNYSGPTPGGGWAGTPYAQMAPNQQTWANTQQTLLGQERANANNPGWSGWSQLTGTPDAIWPTAAAPAGPTPLNEPAPSVNNITAPQTDITGIDPTSTTTTGTPGVPTTGLLAKTYDPNNIATTGTGSSTDSSGSTNYSTDPKDQTTQILSRKGGPITRRVTHPDVSARNIGTQKYDDGGGVSPSIAGAPPGATGGGGAIPPIYYNPATYAAAGAPVGKGVSATSAPTFGAGAIPSLPMARGGAVALADGGDPDASMMSDLQSADFEDARMDADQPAAPATPVTSADPNFYVNPNAAPTAPTTPAAPLDHNAPPPDPTTPQIKDDQGNPSRGLIGAISDGLHWLGEHLGLASSAQAGTLPPAIAHDPQTQSNRQDHVTNNPDGATYMTHQNVEELKDYADPGHQLNDAYRNIAALEAGYKFALSRGDEATAGRLAASMLHYSVLASQNLSDQAAKALYNGDRQGAVDKLNQASDALPDGRLVHATLNDDGTVTIQGKNLNGQVEWQQHGAAATILEHATALGRSGKLQWDSLESQAAKYDSTFANMAKNRQANATQDALDRRQAEREQHQQDIIDQRQKAKEDAAAASEGRVSSAIGGNTLQPVTRVGNAAPAIPPTANAAAPDAPTPTPATATTTTPASGGTSPATPPPTADTRGPTGHGGALPGVTGGDIASPNAQDVSFDSIVNRINNQEQQTNASDAAQIRSRYQTPEGYIHIDGQDWARPAPPNVEGLSKAEQQQAFDAYNKGPLAQYNDKAKRAQDAMNKDIADNRDIRSKQFQTLRDQAGRTFTESQSTARMREQERLQTDRETNAAQRTKDAEADKQRLAAVAPMNERDLGSRFSSEANPEDPNAPTGKEPEKWLAASPMWAGAANNKDFISANSVARMHDALVNTQRFNAHESTDKVADFVTGAASDQYKYKIDPKPVTDDYGTRYHVVYTRPDGSRSSLLVPEDNMADIQRIQTMMRAKNAATPAATPPAVPSRPTINFPAPTAPVTQTPRGPVAATPRTPLFVPSPSPSGPGRASGGTGASTPRRGYGIAPTPTP